MSRHQVKSSKTPRGVIIHRRCAEIDHIFNKFKSDDWYEEDYKRHYKKKRDYRRVKIEIGSKEWDELTNRRATLISKKYSPNSLNIQEEKELNLLNKVNRSIIHKSLSRPMLKGPIQ